MDSVALYCRILGASECAKRKPQNGDAQADHVDVDDDDDDVRDNECRIGKNMKI